MDDWDLYNAFCTINWFATGKQIVSDGGKTSVELYMWYLKIEDALFEEEIYLKEVIKNGN